MNPRLYVANLPVTTTEESLRHAFGGHGTVEHVFVAIDRDTTLPKGYAFVTYATAAEAQVALAAMQGSDFEGQPLAVSEARIPEAPVVRAVVRRPLPPGRNSAGPGARRPGGVFNRPALPR